MEVLKRTVSLLFLAMFILGTLVQFNDPDPIIWVTYWATAALLPLMALTGVNTRHGLFSLVDKLARAAAILVSLYWITTYLPGIKKDYQAKNGNILRMVINQDGDIRMKDDQMELAREFGGAVIILVYTLVLYPLSTVGDEKVPGKRA
ncbi:hypothetical protein NGA_0386700 [Nannochloropsis gaditana CCMP526]|uniref:uncharacterized protein n=1 Tax=Nannochloropsis gaditana (strain CCMP526) TaxID=1093141 RepID=UPI00029F7614|nr:hypothetical protein NGA_0386700 [Nannochloropsis gaditana CCMP526]EKU21391.1 hypothetical protein NGA_0386700 [Nannochloropsis gaditana CCMP526]|eukprot:XP_005854964.1 hypothetical protein NGA_0386700 [Nannochloropsis gaditana CCMP526]